MYKHNYLDGKKYITISPGVTTGELMAFFLNNGVCFESDVILSTVTYGGVLSGGCHVSFNKTQTPRPPSIRFNMANNLLSGLETCDIA